MNFKTRKWKLRERGALVIARPVPVLLLTVSVVAVLLLLSSAYFRENGRARNMVNLKTDPQISLKVNAAERVVGTVAYSEAGQAVLNELDLKGTELDVAVHSVMTTLMRDGYVDPKDGGVDLSVTGRSFTEAMNIRYRLRSLIELMME